VENYAIHLAFSTFPSGKELEFVRAKRKTFSDYRVESEKHLIDNQKIEDCLYNPLIFHLFGTFDVVFVSLIDNYKFCQKVFDVDSPQAGSTTSYQIVTGICNNQFLPTDGIKSYFPRNNNTEQKLSAKKYVHITNFKVNNGLLIGNGNQFVDAVMKKMSEKLKDIDFIIFKSFSWSEIVLLQFGDDLEELQKNIIRFREFSLEDIAEEKEKAAIVNDSLYGFVSKENLPYCKFESIEKSHVFVDSHSYSGVDYFEFNCIDYDQNTNPYKDDKFKSSIEFQVKPGHFMPLFQILKANPMFDQSKVLFKNGKTDYLVKETDHKAFKSNYDVNKEYRHGTGELRRHIRKMKTNFLVDVCSSEGIPDSNIFAENKLVKKDEGVNNFSYFLAVNYTIDLQDLKSKIKKLGVSRQIREKIIKAFSNYNNLVKDTILYSEFIELRGYLLYILKDIILEVDRLDTFFLDPIVFDKRYRSRDLILSEIEEKWTIALDIFEDAYQNRVHNNYLYEDLNEFSIDFNSAVNQINSIQDFLVKTTNNVFFPRFKDEIIVTQNEIDSKSNIINVNYNVYHYLEPTLIFTTLMKEVMNGVLTKADIFLKISNTDEKNISSNYFNDIKREIELELAPELNSFQRSALNSFDFFYYFSDLAKMTYTFLFDYDLYEYWSWAYFMQNSSMYKSSGLPENVRFQRELLKMCLVKNVFNPELKHVRNPAPELFDLWQKSILDIENLSKLIKSNDKFEKATFIFSKFILVDSLVKREKIDDGERISAFKIKLYNDIKENGIINYIEGKKADRKIDQILQNLLGSDNEGIMYLQDDVKILKYASLLLQYQIKNNSSLHLKELMELPFGKFYYICALSNASLSVFKGNESTPKILRRDWQKGIPLIEFSTKEKASLFVDPCGGFFYNSAPLRQEHFGFINRIIDVLWDMAEVDKKRLFIKQNSF
jgi:hypothetical protein